MAEVLELKVKSNIKGVVTEVDSLATALEKATARGKELTENIDIQNSVLIDMKRELIELKQLQSQSTPWENSMNKTADKIKNLTHEIALEENALKKLNEEQRKNTRAVGDTEKAIKKKDAATKKGTPIQRASATAMKGIGTAMKGMGIGLIISAFLLLKKALMSNETVMKAVAKVTNAISNIFSDVVSVITDTYNWVTASTDRFDSMGKVITGLINLALVPLKLQFFAIMLVAQELILKFFEVKDAIPGKNESANIAKFNAKILETKKALRQTSKSAVTSFKSVVNNASAAANEFKAVTNKVSKGIREITVDTEKRNESVVESTGKTAEQIESIEEKLLAFRQGLAEKQKNARKLTELEKIEEARQAHLAELNALEINAEEKARLEDELNELYDNEATEFKKQRAIDEAAQLKAITDENFLLEIEDLKERALARLEIERQAALESVKNHENKLEMEAALNKKFDKAAKKLSDDTLTFEKMNSKEKLGVASDTFGQMSTILGKESAAGKAMAVAQATIQTYLGATKAFTSLSGMGPMGPALGAIAAGAAIASGLANVNAILATPTPGGGGGGGRGAAGGSVPSVPPSAEMMSGTFELGGTPEDVEPARAYVVSDDITENQNGLALIRRRATI